MLVQTKISEVELAALKGTPHEFLDRWVTRKKAAHIMSCSVDKLSKDAWRGTGVPFVKERGVTKYSVRAIFEYMLKDKLVSSVSA